MNSDDALTPETNEDDPHGTADGYEVIDDDGDVLQQVQDTRDELHEATQSSAGEGNTIEAANTADDDRGSEIDEDDPSLVVLAEPFVGQWNTLISTTNWEKGRIIADWRQTLIDEGAPATHYSDEAWVRRVGGVTSPHVGRLRRVYEKFGSTHETYQGVFWSHFLAALDWDDAPLWLEGAAQESWSVSAMREQRWQANGAVESQRPTASQVVEVDLDEDVVLPAQGGGSDRKYDDEADGISVGPIPEGPDFGEEPDYGNGEELSSMNAGRESGSGAAVEEDNNGAPVQPFVGLPKLPDDLTESIESMKLSILRHKSTGWNEVSAEDVERYLDAMRIMLRAQ